jgi:hypothetical protein
MKIIFSLSNMGLNLFVEGRQKLVRGKISCTDENDFKGKLFRREHPL